jgi:hypothetical protein
MAGSCKSGNEASVSINAGNFLIICYTRRAVLHGFS